MIKQFKNNWINFTLNQIISIFKLFPWSRYYTYFEKKIYFSLVWRLWSNGYSYNTSDWVYNTKFSIVKNSTKKKGLESLNKLDNLSF